MKNKKDKDLIYKIKDLDCVRGFEYIIEKESELINTMNKHIDRIERLKKGEKVIYKEGGNSMLPLIKSMQPVEAEYIDDITKLEKGDIVYCKVKGNYYTHLVKAVDQTKGRVLIGNNRGGVNGWTKAVYGKIIRILDN